MTDKPPSRTVAIVQARMGSTRLPRKALLEIGGKPLIWHAMRRVKAAKTLDAVVLAVPDTEANRPLAEAARSFGFEVYEGSEEDLLDRFYQPCRARGAEAVVRICGDNPLVDPGLIDRAVTYFLGHRNEIDYVNTNRPHRLPHGLDAEVFSFDLLETLWREVTDPFGREWFSTVIWDRPERWRQGDMGLEAAPPGHRWTVDYPEDFALMEAIFAELGGTDRIFGYKDVLTLLERRPEIYAINEARRDVSVQTGIDEAKKKAGTI